MTENCLEERGPCIRSLSSEFISILKIGVPFLQTLSSCISKEMCSELTKLVDDTNLWAVYLKTMKKAVELTKVTLVDDGALVTAWS